MKKTILQFAIMLSSLTLITSAVSGQATVTTDKPDYAPGSLAIFTGSGFAGNENVTLRVKNLDQPCSTTQNDSSYTPWTVLADGNGNFTTSWIVCQCPGDSLRLKATGMTSGLIAYAYFSDNNYATLDFQQPINGDTPFTLDWTNGILNATQTTYYEGMGVPQRIIVTGLTTTTGNSHYIKIKHRCVKGDLHAYDFLMSWDQAVTTAIEIGGGPTSNELQNLFVQACDGGTISATGQAACNALNSQFVINPSIPDGMNGVGDALPAGVPDTDVDSRITCFETGAGNYGDRTIEIRGNASFTSATVVFDGYASGANDADALYTISWVSASTDVMFRFAGHLSVSAGECGYGAGQGAGAISGGSYHISLDDIDGNSGSLDNQISANAVTPPPPICNVTSNPVTADICPGNSATLTVSALVSSGTPPYTYEWSNGSTADHITVAPASTTIYTVTVTDANDLSCSTEVTVTVNNYPLPDCNITGEGEIFTGDTAHLCATTGMSGYSWTGPGGFTSDDECIDVTEEGDYTVTITDNHGCNSTCIHHLTVNQNQPPTIDCSAIGGYLGCNPASIPAADDSAPVVDGGCVPVIVTHGTDSIQQNGCNYTLTRTYTATDNCQQTATCNQVFTYSIASALAFDNLPTGSALGCNTPPSCNQGVTASNECGTVSATCTPGTVTNSGTCGRSQTFHYHAETSCGAAANADVTYTWTVASALSFDNLPTGSALGCNTPPSCNQGVTASNECGTVSATCSPGTVSNSGTCGRSQTFHYHAETSCGASANADVTYTWTVASAPVFSGLPTGGALGCNATPPSCGNVTASNQCGAATVTCIPANIIVNGCNRSQSFHYHAVASCGGVADSSVSYTWKVSSSVSINTPNPLPVCGLGGNTLSVTNNGPGTITSYSWTVTGAGWSITSLKTINTITYTTGNSGTSGTFTVVVTNGCGCTSSATVTFGNTCEEHCSYTQGFYGGTGKVCDQSKNALGAINAALTSGGNIVTGFGTRTLTILTSEGSCMNSKMPAGTTPLALPAAPYTPATCSTATGNNWLNSGKFKSVVLGQTLALTVNVRNNASLGSMAITGRYMTTYKASACVNGKATGSKLVKQIPQSVLNCLSLSGNNTVNGLLALANKALGNAIPAGCSASLSDINVALTSINEGFDGCRILAGFGSNSSGVRMEEEENTVASEMNNMELSVHPNPTSGNATLLFTPPMSAKATLDLYNMNGAKVSSLFNSEVIAGEPYGIEMDASSLSPGIYFLHLTVGNQATFTKLVVLGK